MYERKEGNRQRTSVRVRCAPLLVSVLELVASCLCTCVHAPAPTAYVRAVRTW